MESLKKLSGELNILGEINESNIVKVSELLGSNLKTNFKFDTMKYLDLTKKYLMDLFNGQEDCTHYLERLIIGKLGSVVINSKLQTNYTGLMILTLVKNKQEPNYNIVQKIKIKKNNSINKIVGHLMSDHEEINNILILMQYLYQLDVNLEKFINCILLNELYNWLDENEPKTELWKFEYWKNSSKSLKDFTQDIINF